MKAAADFPSDPATLWATHCSRLVSDSGVFFLPQQFARHGRQFQRPFIVDGDGDKVYVPREERDVRIIVAKSTTAIAAAVTSTPIVSPDSRQIHGMPFQPWLNDAAKHTHFRRQALSAAGARAFEEKLEALSIRDELLNVGRVHCRVQVFTGIDGRVGLRRHDAVALLVVRDGAKRSFDDKGPCVLHCLCEWT